MVYLDHNATTPLDSRVLEAMLPYLQEFHGNPSSIHGPGRAARAAIDDARDRLAHLLGVRAHELIFTSGGTESNNLAVLGLARQHASRGRHLITSSTEHHAVLHAMGFLEAHDGFEVTRLPVDRNGLIDPADLCAALRPDTTLVSIMSANNETGVRQDLRLLAEIATAAGAHFHSDVVQSVGKESIRPDELGVDAMSLASHKFYGPKGSGFLWLKSGISLVSLLQGGAQENQRRPGTEDVAGIVGLAAAAELALSLQEAESARLHPLREQLWLGIEEISPTAVRNGADGSTLTNTLNVSFPGADGEALLIGLDLEGVCVSSGSACMVGSIQASHVLLAMEVAASVAAATVRFSLGRSTHEKDIAHTIVALRRVLERCQRRCSPPVAQGSEPLPA